MQLFCVPHAGNGPAVFREWADRLVPEIETIVVELPGRESRFYEVPYQRMEPLVNDLADAVIDCLSVDRSFAFFGNSMGSLIAFETLHEIRRRIGREALHLFVSACGAPQCQPILPPMGHLEDEALISEVDSRYGGIPAPVLADKEFLALALPTLRADICLLEAYPQDGHQSLDCPITAFAGRFDATIPLEQVEAWGEQTSGKFENFVLEEGHLYLDSARDFLLRNLSQALLAAALEERGSQ
ncbi:thioesterase II family protein [Terracidiphilus sp.]|uniref:thioesterase II family protein n=1 Tax=Terracidiphilus sp. TaxID=1964191 RepID=UPI003C16A32B